MPLQEVLVLAMTKMRAGICTAGVVSDHEGTHGVRWVRPVRDFGSVRLGDMTCAGGRLACCSDVVELNLLRPRSERPHVEDWVTDFVYDRPRIVLRLEGEKRARFFAKYTDEAPEDVLVKHTRSLCLLRPERVWVHFSLDPHSGKYEARMGFLIGNGLDHPRASSPRGVTATDLKWRALGRSWLGPAAGTLNLDHDEVCSRLSTADIYLAIGLSRAWRGEFWPLVVGVHVVPDYEANVDCNCL